MIYSIAERMIRKRMHDTGENTPNQLKKLTQWPAFKWVVFLFMGVAEVTVWINGEMHQKIANLNDNIVKIIRLFGPVCEKYHEL
jgi:hypothetical protein